MRLTKQVKLDAIRKNYNLVGIYSVSDIERAHVGHFFDKDAMRFFRSRLCSQVFCGENKAYFITSEQFDYNSPRLYTVREFCPSTRKVETIGEFNKMTKNEAINLALTCAYENTSKKAA